MHLHGLSLLSLYLTIQPLGSSDHSYITVDLTWSATRPMKIRCQMWSYRSADWDQANELLSHTFDISFPESSDVDSIWASCKSQFLTIVSTCILSRIISIKIKILFK